jgi:glutamine synthetase type III
LLFICIYSISNCQTLGQQYYNNTPQKYVSPPVSERTKYLDKAEESYYENKKECNDIEYSTLIELKSLKIDTLNVKYRSFLNKTLESIQKLKNEGFYEDYQTILQDLKHQLRMTKISMKEDEDYIIESAEKEKQRKKTIQQENEHQLLIDENLRLKNEILKTKL